MNNELLESLKKTLADSFAFYLKTHFFHWNVEGPDFFQYHKMLEDIYSDVYGSIDTTAEFIRTLGGYAPGSFRRYLEMTSIETESTTIPDALDMLRILEKDNQTVINTIEQCYELAEDNHEHGLSNFLAEREAAHKKHRWFLNATLAKSV